MAAERGSYGGARCMSHTVQSFSRWLAVRSSQSEKVGGGNRGRLGAGGTCSCCDWRATLQSVVFMHLSVVRPCMECTGSELGLRGGISEHC